MQMKYMELNFCINYAKFCQSLIYLLFIHAEYKLEWPKILQKQTCS